MPSIGAMEIVNKLFSGSKDVSSEVNDAMNTMTVAALEKQDRSDFGLKEVL